jgi:uncharacterized protein (TIGR03435 family)
MNKTAKLLLLTAAFGFAVVPLLSQTSPKPRASFDVISIKPSPPITGGAIRIGGGARGDRYTMSGVTLKMLLQRAYSKTATTAAPVPPAQLQIIGGPAWMDSDRYDIQATADCSGGVLSPEQLQLMVQSMLEDRFQLKAHLETRELPIYNLVAGKDGPKIKAAEDQTPSGPGPAGGGPSQPCAPASATPAQTPPPPPPPPAPGGQRGSFADPNFRMPRGATGIMFGPTSAIRGSAVPITTLVNMLQQQLGRTVIDKTGLKGLFDFVLQFSPEGLSGPPALAGLLPPGLGPGPAGGAGPATGASVAADPVPSLFTAIQELGLRLESAKGPAEVLVVESAQKPTEN